MSHDETSNGLSRRDLIKTGALAAGAAAVLPARPAAAQLKTVARNRTLSLVWIGSREAFESGLGEARRRVADAMSEMLRLTRAAYEACRRNPQDPRVGRSLEALRLEIVEIERNHDKRPELRFYGLADVAEVGLENLRERAWVILDRLSISIASGKSPELPHSALAALEDRIGDYCEQLGLGRGGGRKTRAILESMRNRIAALGASKDLEAEIAALRADSLELAHSATRTEYAAVAELIEKIERWASGPLRDRDSGGILKDLDRALAAWGNR